MLNGAPFAHCPHHERRHHGDPDRCDDGPGRDAKPFGQATVTVALQLDQRPADQATEQPAQQDRPEGEHPGDARSDGRIDHGGRLVHGAKVVAGRQTGTVTGDRTILHVDMDAFFVSVELLRHPELVGQPVVVGGAGVRGVVAAASYEARSYGVHSALGSVKARRLCPDAVFLPGDHAHYGEVSSRIMAILRSVTPLVEPLSLDEAFLDVTGVLHGERTGAEVAAEIRERIHRQESLSCAVGVAPTKFVAKVASKEAKPRVGRPGSPPTPGPGVVVVTSDGQLEFLHGLPVGVLWGVGPVTGRRLAELGVRTVGDLAELPLATLTRRIGSAAGLHLHQLANGVDPRPVVPDQVAKSVGHEETYATDHHSLATLGPELLRLTDATTARMRERGIVGRTVTVKVRYGDFRTVTRSHTFEDPTSSMRRVSRVARTLLESLDLRGGIRLLGVSMSGLEGAADTSRQLRLGMDAEEDWVEAEQVIADIRARFGAGAIAPATLLDPSGLRVRGRGDQQWGPGSDPLDESDDSRR